MTNVDKMWILNCQSPFYTLRFPRYSLDKILIDKTNITSSKVKSRSYFDVAHHCSSQCPFQVSTSYTLSFLRYSPDKILKNQGHNGKFKGCMKVTPLQCTSIPPMNAPPKHQLPTPNGF